MRTANLPTKETGKRTQFKRSQLQETMVLSNMFAFTGAIQDLICSAVGRDRWFRAFLPTSLRPPVRVGRQLRPPAVQHPLKPRFGAPSKDPLEQPFHSHGETSKSVRPWVLERFSSQS